MADLAIANLAVNISEYLSKRSKQKNSSLLKTTIPPRSYLNNFKNFPVSSNGVEIQLSYFLLADLFEIRDPYNFKVNPIGLQGRHSFEKLKQSTGELATPPL